MSTKDQNNLGEFTSLAFSLVGKTIIQITCLICLSKWQRGIVMFESDISQTGWNSREKYYIHCVEILIWQLLKANSSCQLAVISVLLFFHCLEVPYGSTWGKLYYQLVVLLFRWWWVLISFNENSTRTHLFYLCVIGVGICRGDSVAVANTSMWSNCRMVKWKWIPTNVIYCLGDISVI